MTSLTTMYAGQTNSPATTLAANITSTATSISVTDASALPAVPFPLTIGINSTLSETVLVTAKSGNTLTVTRGWDGTASAWNADTPCARVFTARDLNAAQSNILALNNNKAEQSDVTDAVNGLWSDIYASSASGPIAAFYRTVGGLPVNDLTIDITPVQAGTGDPSPTNVRAISGWTGAKVFKAGKNLLPNQKAQANTSQVNLGQSETSGEHIFLKAGTYTFRCSVGKQVSIYYRGTKDTANIRLTSIGASLLGTATFTLTEDDWVRIWAYLSGITTNDVNWFQLEQGSTATDYEPYTGSTISISWQTEAGTVYGGTLDVTTGLLTVTYKSVDMGSLSWSSSSSATHPFFLADISDGQHQPTSVHDVEFWCSAYKALPQTMNGTNMGNDAADHDIVINQRGESYALRIFCRDDTYGTDAAAFTTAVTGQTIVYPLETPVTYQLTPEQIYSLLGENNVWADTGNTTATFGADIKSYIDNTTGGKQDKIFASGILKGNGSGGVSAAVAGTDYQAPLTAGTDYQTPLAENALQYYGVCSTAASTQAKTVTIDGITSLSTGLEIRVKMTNAQTYNGTPTLNVNSLGAKNIMQHGSTAAVRYQWQAGEVVSLTYDGTYWVLENNSLATTTYFGLTRLSSSTSSTTEDIAATPKAVKTAYDLAAAAVPATEKGTSVATLAVVGDSTTPTVPRLTPAQGFAPIFEIDSDTTLAAKHAGGILVCTNSPTITIPVSVFAAATEIEILNYGTGIVTVAGASGVSLNGASAGSKQIKDQYTSGVLLAISASQWVIQGAIE